MRAARRRTLGRLAALGLAIAAGAAMASSPAAGFPERDKTLRLIVPFAAGGGVDSAARLLGTQLQKQLGLSVIVENRAGGSGTIGGKAVQTAAADGYTLLFSAATHVLAQQVLNAPPYDPQTDFAPVARTGSAPLLLVMSASKAPTRLPELIKAVGPQPDQWTAGIPAAGAPSHLATLMLATQAGLRLSLVPYKGTQPALTDVAGGHVDLLLDSMISLLPMAKSGKVKPIAVTSAQRSPLAPDIPTFKESGLPEFVYGSWYGVWAPRNTPPERVSALNAAINAATVELVKSGALASLGIDPVIESPAEFRRFIAADVARGSELLRGAGFKPQ
jgi:tripartite-type tricarboxylate transporter receptor subunit TctC